MKGGVTGPGVPSVQVTTIAGTWDSVLVCHRNGEGPSTLTTQHTARSWIESGAAEIKTAAVMREASVAGASLTCWATRQAVLAYIVTFLHDYAAWLPSSRKLPKCLCL